MLTDNEIQSPEDGGGGIPQDSISKNVAEVADL
jgi:hypothetical protein